MTVASIGKNNEKNRRDDIENLLKRRGLKYGHGPNTYTYVSGLAPSAFDQPRSLKNQARIGAPLQDDLADQYTLDLANGEVFPPNISWQNDQTGLLELCDGNHRLEAHTRCGKALDTYIITCPVETRVLITLEANLRLGRSASKAEKIHHALYAIDNGMTIREAARTFLAEEKDVRAATVDQRVTRRAEGLDIPIGLWVSLKSSSRKRLSNIVMDPVFMAATILAAESKMAQAPLNKFVGEINGATSQEAQMAVIEQWRADLAVTIAERSIGGTTGKAMQRHQGPRHKLRLAMGFIEAIPADPEKFMADMPAGEVPDVLTKLDAALDRMTALRKALADV